MTDPDQTRSVKKVGNDRTTLLITPDKYKIAFYVASSDIFLKNQTGQTQM